MFELFKKIDISIFFISLCIGLFLCYITNPTPNVIIKYPNPDNANLTTYIDEASNCFKYKVDKVECPKDEKLIKELPIQ
jgi:hypothetical protein